MLVARLNGQRIDVRNETVVSDSVKYLTVRFEYSKDWNDYTKTAVFFANDGSVYSVVMLEGNDLYLGENICYVPHEVLKYPRFEISVYGVLDDSVITSGKAVIEVTKSGYCEGETPADPTPTEYQQIISAVESVKEIAQSVRDDADRGVFDGKDAITDQTYNPESGNAQSGKAVAEATDYKMDKFGDIDQDGNVKITTQNFKIYQNEGYVQVEKGDLNIQSEKKLSFKSTANFEKGACVPVSENLDPTAVVNRYYVDLLVGDIETALDGIIAIQNELIGGEEE